MVIYIIMAALALIYYVRKSNNSDLVKKCIKTDLDKSNLKNKTIILKQTQFSEILILLSILSIIAVALIRLTDIDIGLLNYFDTSKIYRKGLDIGLEYYLVSVFILLVRGIILEVNIGDYLQHSYDVHEEEVSAMELAKSVLMKKKPVEENKESQPETTATAATTTQAQEQTVETPSVTQAPIVNEPASLPDAPVLPTEITNIEQK